MATRSSTRLAEKLKKLMEMPASSTNPMECDLDDLKKQTLAAVVKEGVQNLTRSASAEANLPEIKHSWNGVTPPPIAKTHACHGTSHHPSLSQMNAPTNHDTNVNNMDSIAEDNEQEDEPKMEEMEATDEVSLEKEEQVEQPIVNGDEWNNEDNNDILDGRENDKDNKLEEDHNQDMVVEAAADDDTGRWFGVLWQRTQTSSASGP